MQSCCGPLISYLNMQRSKSEATEVVYQMLKCLSADRFCQHNSVTTVQNGNKLYWCVLKKI